MQKDITFRFVLIAMLFICGNIMTQDNSIIVPICPYSTAISPVIFSSMPPDTVNGTWSSLPPHPTSTFGAFSYYWPDSNGIFVGGGTDGTISSTQFRMYSLTSNTYITKASIPVGRSLNKMVRVKNKLYLIATVGAWPATDGQIFEYNPAADTWTLKLQMFPPTVHESGIFVWRDSLIFMVGGTTNGFIGPTNNVRYFNPIVNSWSACPTTFPIPISLTQGECIGNEVIINGGYDGDTVNRMYRGTVIPGSPMNIVWRLIGPALPTSSGLAPYRVPTGIVNNVIIFGPSLTLGGVNNPRLYGFQMQDSTLRRYLPDQPGGGLGNIHNISVRIASDSIHLFTFCGYLSPNPSNQAWEYSLPAKPLGINPEGGEIPELYSLSQNYPNPFNPVTKIKFGLPKSAYVKIVLFDLLGREISALVNEEKNAGSYIVDFDASSLSSGIYFYRIEAGEFTDMKKMVLVK